MTLLSQASIKGWMSTGWLGKACFIGVSPWAMEGEHRCWSPRMGYWLSHERCDCCLV